MRDGVEEGSHQRSGLRAPTLLQRVLKRAFYWTEESVSLPRLRSKTTWENGVEHGGSRWFADTEEDGGSTPPVPTIPTLTRAYVAALI
jgi:hypothetical protein